MGVRMREIRLQIAKSYKLRRKQNGHVPHSRTLPHRWIRRHCRRIAQWSSSALRPGNRTHPPKPLQIEGYYPFTTLALSIAKHQPSVSLFLFPFSSFPFSLPSRFTPNQHPHAVLTAGERERTRRKRTAEGEGCRSNPPLDGG